MQFLNADRLKTPRFGGGDPRRFQATIDNLGALFSVDHTLMGKIIIDNSCSIVKFLTFRFPPRKRRREDSPTSCNSFVARIRS